MPILHRVSALAIPDTSQTARERDEGELPKAPQTTDLPARAPAGDTLLSPEQLSEYLGVPLRTIYQWNHRGVGPTFLKVGRHLRCRSSDIERWLDGQAVQRPAS